MGFIEKMNKQEKQAFIGSIKGKSVLTPEEIKIIHEHFPKIRKRLIRVPKEVTPREMFGRNSKCPCGSGKKYKHCHLGRYKTENQPISAVVSG